MIRCPGYHHIKGQANHSPHFLQDLLLQPNLPYDSVEGSVTVQVFPQIYLCGWHHRTGTFLLPCHLHTQSSALPGTYEPMTWQVSVLKQEPLTSHPELHQSVLQQPFCQEYLFRFRYLITTLSSALPNLDSSDLSTLASLS